jgi:hypothetical protein
MNDSFMKQYNKVKKQEQKMLSHQPNALMRSTISPVKNKIESKIPAKLSALLNAAFYKGFQLVFEKGTSAIEKTYDKDKAQFTYDVANYALDKNFSGKQLRKLSKRANYSKMVNSSISVLEGGVLGFLGVGLPDIPLFIALIMKTIYEVALSYGFDYENDEEKAYILLLICTAVSKEDERKQYNEELHKLQINIDKNIAVQIDITEYMKTASSALSDAMLTAKFIQSIPIVGTVGSVVNYNIINKISKTAAIKYKKRYLDNKIHSMKT